MSKPLTILCISSFHKGEDFLYAAKNAGVKVILITSEKLKGVWAKDAMSDIFYVHDQNDENGSWKMDDVIGGIAWLIQNNKIDIVVALDDFDVEKAAQVREHFRIPGMGQTTCRYFRDKLAMRMKAHSAGISIPAYSAIFNNDEIHSYTQRVSPPWLIKPRSEASATGIKKIHNTDELWAHLDTLGDRRHHYLIEQFRPGDVYHVDALTLDGKVIFSRASRYLSTPMDVAHGGGIFRSMTIEIGTKEEKALQKINAEVLKSFGMQFSASHTEFIKDRETGAFYFLETSSRVGGANLAEMVEFSSGINLWTEWAKIEVSMARNEVYTLPKVKKLYGGIIVSLARQKHPDTSSFDDAEIVWRLNKEYHIGLIVVSSKQERVLELLDKYAERVKTDFHASAPVPDRPTS